MKVLVTGAAGFIGRWACRELARRGHELVAVDCLLEQVHDWQASRRDYIPAVIGSSILGGYDTIYDCKAGKLLPEALEGVDVVLHLAARVGVGQAQYELARYVEDNVADTARFLERVVEAGVPRVVVAGSMAAYGEGAYRCPAECDEWKLDCALGGPDPDPQYRGAGFDHACRCGLAYEHSAVRESHPLRPRSVYGLTKMWQEQLVEQVCEARGLSWASARMFNVYGPEQSLGNPYTGAAAIFTARALRGLAPRVYEDGQQLRSFVYVEDAARALADLVEKDADWHYNVCAESATTVLALASLIAGLHGAPPPVVVGELRSGDVRHCYGEADNLAVATGWHPTVELVDGLAQLAAWAKAHPELAAPSDTAELEMRELRLFRRAT